MISITCKKFENSCIEKNLSSVMRISTPFKSIRLMFLMTVIKKKTSYQESCESGREN